MCQRLVCQKREFAEDHLPMKFKVIDMKHSYFLNYFIICLPSFFPIIIELFVV